MMAFAIVYSVCKLPVLRGKYLDWWSGRSWGKCTFCWWRIQWLCWETRRPCCSCSSLWSWKSFCCSWSTGTRSFTKLYGPSCSTCFTASSALINGKLPKWWRKCWFFRCLKRKVLGIILKGAGSCTKVQKTHTCTWWLVLHSGRKKMGSLWTEVFWRFGRVQAVWERLNWADWQIIS